MVFPFIFHVLFHLVLQNFYISPLYVSCLYNPTYPLYNALIQIPRAKGPVEGSPEITHDTRGHWGSILYGFYGEIIPNSGESKEKWKNEMGAELI